MGAENRRTGIDVLGDVPWGTHLCLFYETSQDLLDILIPYFKAGLENNEFCMWVTSEPLEVEDAERALREAVEGLDDYIAKGQIEILDYGQWYTKSGVFEADRVLQGWVQKEDQALRRGFDGLRLTGNSFWLEREDWQAFADYEATVNDVIGEHRMVAVCTYSLDRCGPSDIIDVVANHQFALVKREAEWEMIESGERKRGEEAIQNLAKFPSENPHPVLRVGEDGTILYANAASEPLLRDWGCGVGEALPPKWPQLAAEVLGPGSSAQLETEHAGRILSFVVVPVSDGGYVNWYGRDITELKHAQQALAKAHEVLEKRVGERTEELARANKALRAEIAERKRAERKINRLNEELQHRLDELAVVNKELQSFSYSVSHDLRAPLRAIAAFSHALKEDCAEVLDAEGKDCLERVLRNCRNMAELIDDLLRLSRVTLWEMQRESVDLSALAKAIAVELQEKGPERRVELVIAEGLVAEGDAHLLGVALRNLFDNAWKFTGKHPQARIEFGATEREGKPTYFVRDDGAGFEMTYVHKLFAPFQRLHPQAEFPGTGIGLATIQRIIHRHGGRVWAEGAEEQGATFYFTL